MHIFLSPMRADQPLSLSRAGDVLTINGEAFDFSALPEGGTLPRTAIACDWIAGDVTRTTGGVLTVPLILPHGPDAPQETLFPEPITLTGDGPVNLPPWTSPAPVDDEPLETEEPDQ